MKPLLCTGLIFGGVAMAQDQYHLIATDDLVNAKAQPHVVGNPKAETFHKLKNQPKTMLTAATDYIALELSYLDLYPAVPRRNSPQWVIRTNS